MNILMGRIAVSGAVDGAFGEIVIQDGTTVPAIRLSVFQARELAIALNAVADAIEAELREKR